ncbi:MAG: hypothetical protein DI537_14440 [Stutzerimonas stutzeri]|nr:MAG: hypothetical protein DI537_14440 [Stutzerimonas stutzeri]
MTNFQIFAKAVKARFEQITKGEAFVTTKTDLFETYLGIFKPEDDPIYRVRTWHDGAFDKQFIRSVGNVVAIVNGKVETIWDIPGLPHPYDYVAAAMADVVRGHPIKGVYRTKEHKFSTEKNVELKEGVTTVFHHLHCTIPNHLRTAAPDKIRGDFATAAQVFRRGLDELTPEALDTVLDLINTNAIYRGAEHKNAVGNFRKLHRDYPRGGSETEKALYVWSKINDPAARFRNTVIGTLVTALSAGEDLEVSVAKFEKMVAPENYKRTSALITPKMIDGAVAKLKELGLESAIERRFARIEDVSVNNVLFVDNAVRGQMKDGLAGLLMEQVKPAKVDIKHAEKISIEEFLARIVPQASSIDLLVENNHLAKFMSLTAPVDPAAGRLFKWNNGFAWSYDGDTADSSIKQRVKSAGGLVDGVLRVSLGWFNYDDLDLHCHEPGGRHIFYANPGNDIQRRVLDVDMNAGGPRSREPVENLAWERMPKDGTYRISVNQWSRRETIDFGFTLEVESGGQVHNFTYDKAVAGTIHALQLTITGGQLVAISTGSGVVGGSFSQEKWGVKTETLVPVNTLLASPNHWDGEGIGNKHWFFILKGCLNSEPARGIYNEFLMAALDAHRKVFEVLGAKTKCPVVPQQLSGVGFSSTRADEATVVVKGTKINKAFRITF